MARAGIL